MAKSNPITHKDAARIQRATTKANDGTTPKDSFASRAKRAAEKNTPSRNS